MLYNTCYNMYINDPNWFECLDVVLMLYVRRPDVTNSRDVWAYAINHTTLHRSEFVNMQNYKVYPIEMLELLDISLGDRRHQTPPMHPIIKTFSS